MAGTPARLSAARLAVACLFSTALVFSAPFVGQIRSAIRTAFPGQFVTIVGGVVAVAIASALLSALIRIRDRRLARYGAIAAAMLVGVGYAVLTRTGRPGVDAVERFHFVEYGIVTFLFYRAWRHLDDASRFVLPILAGLIVGTFEEWFQWFVPARVGEMKDIFLNGVAIGCGLLVSYAIDPPARLISRLSRASVARVALLTTAALVVFAAFFHVVHLGFDIRHEGATFRSRYDADRLLTLARDRAARWKENPPLELVRLSREDQYMTEGLVHVQRRNESVGRGELPCGVGRECDPGNVLRARARHPVVHFGHRSPLAGRRTRRRGSEDRGVFVAAVRQRCLSLSTLRVAALAVLEPGAAPRRGHGLARVRLTPRSSAARRDLIARTYSAFRIH